MTPRKTSAPDAHAFLPRPRLLVGFAAALDGGRRAFRALRRGPRGPLAAASAARSRAFARLLAQILARLAPGRRRVEQRHAPRRSPRPAETPAACCPLPRLRLSPSAPHRSRRRSAGLVHLQVDIYGADLENTDFDVQVLLRILLESSATSVRNSLTAPFMFSYNCLSFSNWPAVPSPSFSLRHQVDRTARVDRIEPVEERRIGDQLAGGAFAPVQPVGQVLQVRRRAGQRLRRTRRRSAACRGCPRRR